MFGSIGGLLGGRASALDTSSLIYNEKNFGIGQMVVPLSMINKDPEEVDPATCGVEKQAFEEARENGDLSVGSQCMFDEAVGDMLTKAFDLDPIGTTGGTGQVNTGASAEYIPDCSVNNGNAAIACTAIDQLLDIRYSLEERAAPTTKDPVPALDCSAFTGMAVYRTFGTNLGGIASTQYLINDNFARIEDIRTIQPGDLIGKGSRPSSQRGGSGHIAVVVSYNPTTQELITAETDGRKNPSRVVTTKGLKVDGKGNYEWAVRYTGPKGTAP